MICGDSLFYADVCRWIVGLLTQPGYELREEPTRKEYLERVKQLIGDDSIKVEILDVTKWYINEVVAEHYSRGNMYVIFDLWLIHSSFSSPTFLHIMMSDYSGPHNLHVFDLG